jgi:hypothetical protein
LTGSGSLFPAAFGIFKDGARKLGNSATIVGEGATEGVREGAVDGVRDGAVEGVTDGVLDGTVEGIRDGDALFAIDPTRALLIEP